MKKKEEVVKKNFLIILFSFLSLTLFSSDFLLNDCESLKSNGVWQGQGAERKITEEEKLAITQGKNALKIIISNTAIIKDDIAILSDFKPGKFSGYKGIYLDVYVPCPEQTKNQFFDMSLYADSILNNKIMQKIADDVLLTCGKNSVYFEFKMKNNKEDEINEKDNIDRLNFIFIDKKENNIKEIYFDNIKLISKTPTVTPTPTAMPDKK